VLRAQAATQALAGVQEAQARLSLQLQEAAAVAAALAPGDAPRGSLAASRARATMAAMGGEDDETHARAAAREAERTVLLQMQQTLERILDTDATATAAAAHNRPPPAAELAAWHLAQPPAADAASRRASALPQPPTYAPRASYAPPSPPPQLFPSAVTAHINAADPEPAWFPKAYPPIKAAPPTPQPPPPPPPPMHAARATPAATATRDHMLDQIRSGDCHFQRHVRRDSLPPPLSSLPPPPPPPAAPLHGGGGGGGGGDTRAEMLAQIRAQVRGQDSGGGWAVRALSHRALPHLAAGRRCLRPRLAGLCTPTPCQEVNK
jgi:hypothetical protein